MMSDKDIKRKISYGVHELPTDTDASWVRTDQMMEVIRSFRTKLVAPLKEAAKVNTT